MATDAEINLGQTVHAVASRDVNEQGNLDAVRGFQRDGLEGASSSGGLAGERLADLAETGKQQ